MSESQVNILEDHPEEDLLYKKKVKFYNVRTKLLPPFLQLLADILSLNIAYLLHFLARYQMGLFEAKMIPDPTITATTAFVLMLYWIAAFWMAGLYKNWYIRSPFDELFTVIKLLSLAAFYLFLCMA
jgi:hypothetical protein